MSDLASLLAASLSLDSRELEQVARGLTITEAKQLLFRVGSAAERGDLDGALRAERMLHLKCIRAVASGHKQSRELADIALLTTAIKFDRND